MGEGKENTSILTSSDSKIDLTMMVDYNPIIPINKVMEGDITKSRFSISGKIIDIIENGQEGEIVDKQAGQIGEFIRKYIMSSFKNIEEGDLVSIFKRYFNGDNSLNISEFNEKFYKYFPIHFPILIKKIKEEISKLEIIEKKINNEDLVTTNLEILHSKKENLVLNFLKKYSYIIFIFGEKIKFGELDKLLKLDIKAIGSLRQSVSQNMKMLEGKEQKQINILNQDSRITNSDNDSLLNDHICATTYKNTFRKVMSEGEDITIMKSLDNVGKEIEKLYRLEFKKLYIAFEKWYDSDGTLGEDLFHLEDIIKKILWSISIFKESNIAFTETFCSTHKQGNFLQEVDTQLIKGNLSEGEKELLNLFKNLLEIILNGGKIEKYKEFINNINILKEKIAKSRIPKTLKNIDDLNLDEVDFNQWDNTPENQKYKLMFSEIIGKDGKLIISKYLKLDELDDELITLFTQSYGIDYNVVLAQFQEIKGLAKSNISIKDFVRNDLNNLNLIIIWWRFLLKIRKLDKNNELLITTDEIGKLKTSTKNAKKTENITNINLSQICFDGWDKIPENQKHEFLFTQIIGKDGKIIISKYLKLDKLDEGLILLFAQSYGENFDNVMNILKEIKGLVGEKTEKIYRINNYNDLIKKWWEFLLKIRKIKKEKIKEIKEKPYGIIEIISEKLEENGILESYKLEFKPGGKLNNISVQTILEQLKSILKGFKKGPVDLFDTKIGTGETHMLVKDLTDLYIPIKLSDDVKSTNIDEEMNNINDWLNSGIDLCFNLLHNKPISDENQKSYLELLKNHQIIPRNINELEIKDKDNIKDLAEALKYIKPKRKKLIKMMKVGNKDKLKLIELLSSQLGDNKEKMIADFFGPNKSFTRSFIKLIKLYSGDYTLISDLTRLRIVEDNINDLITSIIKFISFAVNNEEITKVSIMDLIGEPISDPIKPSGYRDIKLLLNLKGGNVVEQQFQYKEMLDAKEIGIDLTNKENLSIFDKLKKEEKLFTLEEIKELIQFCQNKNIELPTADILNKLLREGNVYGLINELGMSEESFSNTHISSTYTYSLIRQLPEGSELGKKLIRLERAINDNAWSGAVLKYLESKEIKIE